MNIVFLGDFRHDYQVSTAFSEAMASGRNRVVCLQENLTDARTILGECISSRADLFFYVRTWSIIGGGAWLLEQLRRERIPTASFDFDLYLGLGREWVIQKEAAWKMDFVFTTDGGHDADLKRLGVKHYYLPAAINKTYCYRGQPNPKYAADVVFVGNYYYHDEWPHRRQLIGFLQAPQRPWIFRLWGHEQAARIRGHDLNALYATAKVVVADSLCPNFTHPDYFSDRVFETLGRGGTLVHPRVPGLEKLFQDGVHLRYYDFGDWSGLQKIITELLCDEPQRRRLSEAGFQAVQSLHTYHHRWQSIQETVY